MTKIFDRSLFLEDMKDSDVIDMVTKCAKDWTTICDGKKVDPSGRIKIDNVVYVVTDEWCREV